jgi:hypothetical protein
MNRSSADAVWARAPAAPDPGWWRLEAVEYGSESPTTDGLFRIRGAGGSLFVKVVRSHRHWARFDILPPELRERAQRASAWRYEVDLYRSNLGRLMPPGFRLPDVHGVEDLGDDRVALYLEDVAADPSPWPRARFERAARLLGRLNVRLSAARDLRGLPVSEWDAPGERTRIFHTSRLLPFALPALSDDALWRHPLFTGAAARRLRADLFELAERIPDMFDISDGLPQVVMHGDATPHNLLVPVDDPDTFVVIDWGLAGRAAVGDELGQLLVGPAHEGELAAADLPALHDAIVGAYVTGLDDEGLIVAESVVRYGMDVSLVVRSAFTALPLERLAEPVTDDLAAHVAHRLELTRYLVDVGLALPVAPAWRRVTGRDESRHRPSSIPA